jgi:hypothetical protein
MCLLIAISGTLYAQDGVTLIDQTSALTGNVTPGDAPGFPVTISRSGSYRLGSNLILPNAITSGIQITAPNVTLDLNGFSIIGPGVCTQDPLGFATCPTPGQAVGVSAGDDQTPGPRSITVLNGSVRGMTFTGIQLTGDGSTVERVKSDGNFRAGFDVNGTVSESSATGNGFDGIVALTARNNTSVKNRRFGVEVRTLGGLVTGNIAMLNGNQGITAAESTITGNTSTFNQGAGILADCPSVVAENTAVQNAQNNIETVNDGCVLVNDVTFP